MNLLEFRESILDVLKDNIENFTYSRIESSYKDLLNLSDIFSEISSQINYRDQLKYLKSNNQDKLDELHFLESKLVTVLKAFYMFSNVFVIQLIGETSGKMGLSLKKLINKSDTFLSDICTDDILPMYCVSEYRNKIIEHHDFSRYYTYKIIKEAKNLRLVPFAKLFHINKDDKEAVQSLKEKYKSLIPKLRNEDNYFELLKILFYNIPLGSLGEINPDRKLIDKISERGGCESMTYFEILEAVDKFSDAICKAVKNQPDSSL